MFEVIDIDARALKLELFTASVGVKSIKARYYVRVGSKAANIIESVAEVSFSEECGACHISDA